MKKLVALILILSLALAGCTTPDSDPTASSDLDLHQSAPSESTSSQTDPTDHLEGENSGPDPSATTSSTPTVPDSSENDEESTEGTVVTRPTEGTTPAETQPPQQATETPTTPTAPTEGTIPADIPKPVDPQPETEPPTETQPEQTEPEVTEPQIDKTSYEFKRQVAQYAAQYLNQYRAAAGVNTCTVLPGMTLVAEYRADQLTYNYSHDPADKREALAYYEYGKWVDATIVGLDPSESYYDAEASEAICAGFEGKTAEEMGKRIADMIRNSSSHWSYVGSSKFSYIGIGVEYRAGTAYGWYACVMVGRTNYG